MLEGAISRLDFARALGGLAMARGNDLLRVKGIVAFADRPQHPAVVQAAQHAMFAPEWLDDWPDDDHRSRLVFVVHDIAPEEILDRFAFAAPSLGPRLAASRMPRRITHKGASSCSTSSSPAAWPSCPPGPQPADIGIAGRARSPRSARPAASPRSAPDGSVDASGQIVIPGGIDPHVHCNWPMPVPATPANLTEPASTGSARPALFGGTTTTIDFAPVEAGNDRAAGDRAAAAAMGRRLLWRLRLSHHAARQYRAEILGQLAEAVQAGHPSVKMFTTDITPSRKGRMVDFGDIWEVLKVLAKAGGIAAIHAEDNDIVMHMYEKLIARGAHRL